MKRAWTIAVLCSGAALMGGCVNDMAAAGPGGGRWSLGLSAYVTQEQPGGLFEIPIGGGALRDTTLVLGGGQGGDPGEEYAEPEDEMYIEGVHLGLRQYLGAGKGLAGSGLRLFVDAGVSIGSKWTAYQVGPFDWRWEHSDATLPFAGFGARLSPVGGEPLFIDLSLVIPLDGEPNVLLGFGWTFGGSGGAGAGSGRLAEGASERESEAAEHAKEEAARLKEAEGRLRSVEAARKEAEADRDWGKAAVLRAREEKLRAEVLSRDRARFAFENIVKAVGKLEDPAEKIRAVQRLRAASMPDLAGTEYVKELDMMVSRERRLMGRSMSRKARVAAVPERRAAPAPSGTGPAAGVAEVAAQMDEEFDLPDEDATAPSGTGPAAELARLAERRHKELDLLGEAAAGPAPVAAPGAKEPDAPREAAAAPKDLEPKAPALEEAVPGLVEALKDGVPDARADAARGLGEIGPAAGKAVPALMAALEDTHFGVRRNAADALASIGPAAVPSVILALEHESAGVRWGAVRALGKIGAAAEGTAPALGRVLRDTDRYVRRSAAEALVNIGAAAVSTLVQALEDEDRLVRRSAADALGKIGPAAEEAVPALNQALEDADRGVRRSARLALKRIQPEEE